METVFMYINIIGSIALAISGALTAMSKRFDGFGVMIIAFVTAVGGGTLRDMLLTEREVFWLTDTTPLYFILLGTVIAIAFRSKQKMVYKPLLLFDAIGLAFFTITGVQIGIEQELSGLNCIILGTITGTFGGIIRDTLVNEIPIIFRKEIYATISLAGGGLYFLLHTFNTPQIWKQIIPIALIIIARLVVVYFNISLPSIYRREK